MTWNIYLSGEIHTDWRERIKNGLNKAGLSITLTVPNTNHESCDDCGDIILGAKEKPFWKDHKASRINAIHTRNLIDKADVIMAIFMIWNLNLVLQLNGSSIP